MRLNFQNAIKILKEKLSSFNFFSKKNTADNVHTFPDKSEASIMKHLRLSKSFGHFFNTLINNHYLIFTIVLSFILNIAIEIGARRSFADGLTYIITYPLFFVYNVALIVFTFSIALLCRKRIFSMLLILTLWIAAGITNSILLYFRRSPFIAADFTVLKSAISVMNAYMTNFQMFLVVAAILIVFSSLIILLIREKKKTVDYRKLAVLLAVSVAASTIPSDYITAEKNQSIDTNITGEAYKYGFVCCFLNSVFNSGVNKPEEYNKHNINSIVKAIGKDNTPKMTPNIIVIQLESFVDPYKIPGARFCDDPVPNFRYLKKNYSSGILNVSVYGGGTANTEFEVLTGMNVNYFGIGEYPYESLLKKQTTESICYNLAELGYTSHALHNHTGTFYDRNEVYKNLGFDTFTPSEYMNDIEYNLLTWEKSNVFTKEIFNALSSTEGQDFIFTVTSQCHGKYPEDYNNSNYEVSGSEMIRSMKPELEYFADQLHEEDEWLGEIIAELEVYPEPVMVIIYGDHMPALSLSDDLMQDKSIYQTEYVIWSNYPQDKEDMELSTFNLIPKALSTVDINNGYFVKLHQYALKNGIDCTNELKNLQYDVTNGEDYLYNQQASPHKPKDTKLGINDIIITDVIKKRRTTVIKGENFTPSSVVYVDGNSVKTVFVDSQTLFINNSDCKNYTQIQIAQKAANLTVLGYSQAYYADGE